MSSALALLVRVSSEKPSDVSATGLPQSVTLLDTIVSDSRSSFGP